MRKTFLIVVLLIWVFSRPGFAQEYSYSHYDITDGLAGSTVYCITQDTDGFLWMGTETGVSRFDGTHFRNFTTSEGLPDIEVLQMFGDSRGRVWIRTVLIDDETDSIKKFCRNCWEAIARRSRWLARPMG